MNVPPLDCNDLVAIEAAGKQAFINGAGGYECPYAFNLSPFWETKDYSGFDREWRPKLDAWMRGWISEQKRTAPTKKRPAR